jgi:hypothetical protein
MLMLDQFRYQYCYVVVCFLKKSLNLITQGYTINIDVATPSSKNLRPFLNQYELGRAWQNKMALIGPNFLNVSLIFREGIWCTWAPVLLSLLKF